MEESGRRIICGSTEGGVLSLGLVSWCTGEMGAETGGEEFVFVDEHAGSRKATSSTRRRDRIVVMAVKRKDERDAEMCDVRNERAPKILSR